MLRRFVVPAVFVSLLTLVAMAQSNSPPGSWSLSAVPRGDSHVAPARASGGVVVFYLTNTGTARNRVRLSCSGTNGITCDALDVKRLTLNPGETTQVVATITVGSTSGAITLRAEGTSGSSAEAESPVTVVTGTAVGGGGVAAAQCGEECGGGGPTYGVEVGNPAGVSRPANSGPYTAYFTVYNSGSTSNTYTLLCSTLGGVTCGSVMPTSMMLQSLDDNVATVTYSVGSTNGTLRLKATGFQATDIGSMGVTAIANPLVSLITPAETTSGRAVVHNRQPVIRATYLPNGTAIDTSDTVLKWDGEDVTALARHNRGVLEWEVDSTRWLIPGDSAEVELKICNTASGCTTETRWAVLLDDDKPILGFSGMPLGALNAGFGAPFGPGISVSGAEVETGLGTVPYFSMGAARSAGLVYSTRQSYPRALVPVDLELTWPSGTPSSIKLYLWDGAVKMDSLVVTSPTCATGSAKRCRAVLEADFSSSTFSTPTRKWLTIEAQVWSGATVKSATDSIEVAIVDRRTTRYGAGWWPSGMLSLVQSGNDRLLVGAAGTVTVFRGNGDSLYVGPPGTTSVLKKTTGGWELSPRGSTSKLAFDTSGRLRAGIDNNSNADSLLYEGSTDKLLTLKDPVGKTITLAYDGNGKLKTFTDPGGRKTAVSINSSTNQLTYDSLSSNTTKPYTTTYKYQVYNSSTKTVVLTKRIGVITDTTTVVYDSTFKRRPKQVTLPQVKDETGSSVNPTISYTAYERQGYTGFRSLDSVYVELKDPRNNWSRSLLNRWGQSLESWDSLGATGRAKYHPDGRVQWAEGANGDSSRVYSVYDDLRRLVTSYVLRSTTDTLRGDSLVYDSNHRIIRTVDNRGKVDSVQYDPNGNVTRMVAADGGRTAYYYRSDGLVDSLLLPGSNKSRWYSYEGTWKNVWRLIDESGSAVALHYYDNYGRRDESQYRVGVEVDGVTTEWQWRRTLTYYTVSNQVDSAVSQRTENCTTCLSAPPLNPWPASNDTLKTRRGGVIFDRAGRDSIRLGDRAMTDAGFSGGKVLYLRDRLGRVVSRRPHLKLVWATAKDSMVYDVAGNVVKTITRRGDTLTATFDSRNRKTHTVIPGVGTLRREFNGPLDQVTRIWYDNPVDSIGRVNGEVRYGYDERGRLVADTSYTGTTIRSFIHTYDQYERDSTTAGPLGTWRTAYDSVRGFANELVTPFGDTLRYRYDTRGRPFELKIHSSGPVQTRSRSWDATGALSTLRHSLPGWTAGKYERVTYEDEPGESPALGMVWTESDSVTTDSAFVDLEYDGWSRLTWWKTTTEPDIGADSLSLSFDRAGNVDTGAETYAAATDRLSSRLDGDGYSWAYQYDNAGNMTTATGTKSGQPTHTWIYQYDALNRLSAVRYDAVLIARYGYDVLGRRIAKRVYNAGTGGTVEYLRFVYRGSQVSFEVDSAGTVGTRYVWGVGTDNLVAMRTGTTTRYVVIDKLGSVRGLVDRDGTWYSSVRYTPYGAIARTSGPAPIHRYRWTGREYDAETGLYFHRARYYSPDMRRFTQEDPIGYAGASNLYAYVDGDVLEARDPSGLLKSTVDGPRGFRPECTLGGSQLNWDGSVGTCSATHVGADGGGGGGLLAWAALFTTLYDVAGTYSEYVDNFNALKAQANATINQRFFSMATPLSENLYEKSLKALRVGVLAGYQPLVTNTVAYLQSGRVYEGMLALLALKFDIMKTAANTRHSSMGPLTMLNTYLVYERTPYSVHGGTFPFIANVLIHEYSHSVNPGSGGAGCSLAHQLIYDAGNNATGINLPC